MDYLHESAASIYRRRRRRRALTTMAVVTLVLFATLVYAGSYVQGWVGTPAPKSVLSASCSRSNQSLTPRAVTVNVYNTTSRTGLASSAAMSLQKQGFRIATIDNDPMARTILGVGEIRHGQSGLDGAILAAKRLPGASLVLDDRMDSSVDIVLGRKFRTVTVPPKAAVTKAARPTGPC